MYRTDRMRYQLRIVKQNEVETLVLLVSGHTERDKDIARDFTMNMFSNSVMSPLSSRAFYFWVTSPTTDHEETGH